MCRTFIRAVCAERIATAVALKLVWVPASAGMAGAGRGPGFFDEAVILDRMSEANDGRGFRVRLVEDAMP